MFGSSITKHARRGSSCSVRSERDAPHKVHEREQRPEPASGQLIAQELMLVEFPGERARGLAVSAVVVAPPPDRRTIRDRQHLAASFHRNRRRDPGSGLLQLLPTQCAIQTSAARNLHNKPGISLALPSAGLQHEARNGEALGWLTARKNDHTRARV